MAVKKRNVWINDEDWTAMGDKAQAEGKTISVLIRERLLTGNGHDPRFGSPRPAPKGK